MDKGIAACGGGGGGGGGGGVGGRTSARFLSRMWTNLLGGNFRVATVLLAFVALSSFFTWVRKAT